MMRPSRAKLWLCGSLLPLILLGVTAVTLYCLGRDRITENRFNQICRGRWYEDQVAALLGKPPDVTLTPQQADAEKISSIYTPGEQPCVVKRWIGRKGIIQVYFYANGESGEIDWWVPESSSWFDNVLNWLKPKNAN